GETQEFYVILAYSNGKCELFSIDKRSGKKKKILMQDEFFSMSFEDFIWEENQVTVSYESPLNPPASAKISLATGVIEWTERPQETRFNPKYFEIKQTFAVAEDGEKVPITYLNRKFIKEKKGLILKAYGAYGSTPVRSFSSEDLAFADLGFVVAYAHVRGGMEKGKSWYEEGKKLNKINSITDLVDCANHLIDQKLATDSTITLYGVSAGGVAVGGAANLSPELFNTVVLDRPFLDVVTTQSNDLLPLSILEFSEVGNPSIKEEYEALKNICPYQNLDGNNYPNVIYFGGRYDQNTAYWNILKHVAKIRNESSNNNFQLVNINNGSHYIPWSRSVDNMSDLYAFLMYNLVQSYGNSGE
ncbi:MAG: prolyl oligopeptidase family serine peptidase, partial [Flavobacteriales bacterium]|nr:prolyl oligopeptidase family serine peptidase [Flavobacteriales bacterium]